MASETSSEHRREHDQEERGAHEVEGALDREVHALEHRRLELEERQRLAGHELDPVHEDLHRGRRHAHAHAVAVAAVHQLHGLVLGEVGVGDQHLVDRRRSGARAARASWKSSRPLDFGAGVRATNP